MREVFFMRMRNGCYHSNEPSSPCSDSRTSAADYEDNPQIPTVESTVILESNRSAAEEKAFCSTVVRDIGSLKTCVDTMKSELQELKSALSKDERSEDELDTCMLYIRFKKVNDDHVDKILLQSRLNSSVLAYDMIRDKPTPAFRVKIHKTSLHSALSHARANGCIADLWRGAQSRWIPPPDPSHTTRHSSSYNFLTVTTWNCRGLATATPYLHKLVERGADIIVLSEHWLWPFDLYKLDEVHPDFTGLGDKIREEAVVEWAFCGENLWTRSQSARLTRREYAAFG